MQNAQKDMRFRYISDNTVGADIIRPLHKGFKHCDVDTLYREIAPQGHFLTLRVQGATPLRARNDMEGRYISEKTTMHHFRGNYGRTKQSA